MTLSYCCWSSRTSVSRHWMLGSSCRVVRTSSACSNNVVQSCTALPISSNPTAIVLARCSQTSEGVEGCAFNYSLAIWSFSSNWTLVVSSLASQTTTCTNCWFHDTNPPCCKLSYSIFIFSSLRTWIVRLSLVHSSTVIPSYSRYNVSHGRAAKLRPRSLIMLTTNLSVSFAATRAPSHNTIVFSIRARSFCSIAEDPAARRVERVPT